MEYRSSIIVHYPVQKYDQSLFGQYDLTLDFMFICISPLHHSLSYKGNTQSTVGRARSLDPSDFWLRELVRGGPADQYNVEHRG